MEALVLSHNGDDELAPVWTKSRTPDAIVILMIHDIPKGNHVGTCRIRCRALFNMLRSPPLGLQAVLPTLPPQNFSTGFNR